jgi:hypothetical protein
VLAPEQDSVRQHAQGHQGHWHQEAIPEVLSLEEACLFPKRNKLTSPFTYKEKKKKSPHHHLHSYCCLWPQMVLDRKIAKSRAPIAGRGPKRELPRTDS